MTHACPLCGHTAPTPDVAILLKENRIVVGNEVIEVRPREAEVAYVLWNNYPKFLTVDYIIKSVYGDAGRNIHECVIRHIVRRLRSALSNTPLEIDNERHVGYRFEFRTPDPHTSA